MQVYHSTGGQMPHVLPYPCTQVAVPYSLVYFMVYSTHPLPWGPHQPCPHYEKFPDPVPRVGSGAVRIGPTPFPDRRS